MKIFTKKNVVQKIIIAILIVLSFNFIMPTYSSAINWSSAGGVLISPLVDLVCSLGDIVINLLERAMTGAFGSSAESMNWSLSAFLMESEAYYKSHTSPTVDSKTTVEAVNSYEFDKGWLGLKNEYYIPVATYSPEQIFSGNIAGLDINFIEPNKYEGQSKSSASRLQPTIAKWYVALRNLSVVGLLSVLVYVAIRMIMASTGENKAKYKQMFTDWLIALCLVFFLHYIMSFVLTLTQSICTAIGGDGENTIIVHDITTEGGSGEYFSTNLIGLARFKTQSTDIGTKITYLIFYIMLIGYTLVFTWQYLKRLLMMAFLTIIAPLVALTYPIDKIGDGKAQAFDKWLKEYVFNALLQPFHLIIYTVFVGSAMDLAATNMIYAIATMGFIIGAEKILRNIFGFEKAGLGTMGTLAAANLMGGARRLMAGRPGGSKGSIPGGKDDKGEGAEKPPRYEKSPGVERS